MKILDRLLGRSSGHELLVNAATPPQQDAVDMGSGLDSLIPPNAYFTGAPGQAMTTEDRFFLDVFRSVNYRPPGELYYDAHATGWDLVSLGVSKQGKVARIINTEAKAMMSYDFECRDDQTKEFWVETAKAVSFKRVSIEAARDWLRLGRFVLEPVYTERLLPVDELLPVPRKPGQAGTVSSGLDEAMGRPARKRGRVLKKIVRVNPCTIRVFKDNATDIGLLKMAAKDMSDLGRWAGEINTLEVGGGDEIVGFVQYWGRMANHNPIFFSRDELVYHTRNEDYDAPYGVSVIRENFRNIMHKFKIELGEATMASRYVDPLIKFFIPEKWWPKRLSLITQIKLGIKNGLNIYMPTGMDAKAMETQGTPEGVLKVQEHIESQVVAGMGFADSFTDSNSSNRSVGDIQISFFENDLEADRELFADLFKQRLIDPYLKENGFKVTGEAEVVFKFKDLTPKDELENMKVLVSTIPFMTKSMAIKFFTDAGYPPLPSEENELMEKLKNFVPPRQDKTAAPKVKKGKGSSA